MKIKKGIKQGISKFLLVGIGAVVALYLFFIYIQHVFTSEVESKLIEAANARAMVLSTNLNSDDEISILSIESSESYSEYFSGKCNYYIVDSKGEIIPYKTDIVGDIDSNYDNLKINFNEEHNKEKRNAIRESLISENHAVESFLLENGENLYIGVVPIEGFSEYYSVSMVLDSIIKEQLKPLWRIIAIICVLMGFALIIGITYFYVKKYLRYHRKFQQSGKDELTGLSNRALHQREVSGHFNTKEHPYAYVILSVSNYNFMNEFFGYDYGDSIIKFVADCLVSDIKQGEVLGRISVTGFGMLLEYSDELSLRHRLVKMIKKASNITTNDFNNMNTIVFSCGVSVLRSDDTYQKIKDRVEMARKNAKLEAKYNIIFYEDSIHKQRLEEELLQSEMVDALNNQEFKVFLQPKFSIGKEELIGAEALLRWMHPQKGMLYPSVFIPLFEAKGFMKQIDLFVLTEICKLQFQRRYEEKTEISMSMNISSQLLRERDIVNQLLEIVDSYGLQHHCIEFELSETLVYECQEYIKEIVNELKEAGFFVSLNNFGSGYSSVETFKNIPFDVIKLDKDLLKDFNNAENQTDDKMIITHIISMAKELKLDVLAKGVETDGQKKFIEESKCDMIQGFFYAKPMPFEVFNDYA